MAPYLSMIKNVKPNKHDKHIGDGQPNNNTCKYNGKLIHLKETFPDSKVHGAHLGPVGPRWAPCWPHELWYQGYLVYPWARVRNNYQPSYNINYYYIIVVI